MLQAFAWRSPLGSVRICAGAILLVAAGCSFKPGQAPAARDASVDDGPVDSPPVDAPAAPPTSCNALHTSNPMLPSGTYQIDPDGSGGGAPVSVQCDMSTEGGGWTIVFLSTTTNLTAPPMAYTAGTPRLMADATDTLVAYRDSMQNAAANYASFGLPGAWRAGPPFGAANVDLNTSVSVNGAAPIAAMLRFGGGGFSNKTCGDKWAAGMYGRICIVGTDAPFFTGFASTSLDDCSQSSANYDAVVCSSLRFSIAVR